MFVPAKPAIPKGLEPPAQGCGSDELPWVDGNKSPQPHRGCITALWIQSELDATLSETSAKGGVWDRDWREEKRRLNFFGASWFQATLRDHARSRSTIVASRRKL